MKAIRNADVGVCVQRKDGSLIVIPTGRSMVIGFGRLHVRDFVKKDVGVFEAGEWRFAALCHKDAVVVAPHEDVPPPDYIP